MKVFIIIIACLLAIAGCTKTMETKHPLKRAKYYRIKQVDKDGKINYSNAIK